MSLGKTQYDYIIAGGGCAGLSLATRIVSNEKLRSRKILLIDKEEKRHNDRTWCFWEKEAGFFEPIVFKTWETLDFLGNDLTRRLDIRPYRYKMIRSTDFYRHCNAVLSRSGQVERLNAAVESFRSTPDGTEVTVGRNEYSGKYLFNSTLNGVDYTRKPYIFLRQHFRGWVIEAQNDTFDATVGTLMDFRVSQDRGTAFFYTLPFSSRRALVEYTLFTREVLTSEEYTTSLRNYISEYITKGLYKIDEEENGVIPMTNYPFKVRDGNVINIGTAGGHTKASTGYTFQFIQKAAASIVSSMANQGNVDSAALSPKRRFSRYDSILLRVLEKNESRGAALFSEIFRKGAASSVLRFLDNESSIGEELVIMSRMPKIAFAKAALKEFIGG
jgi:lycopene beta-cyclase